MLVFLSQIDEPEEKAFFTGICDRYYPLMKYWACRGLQSAGMSGEQADDVVQDAFVRILNKYEKLRGADTPYLVGYLCLTVRSAASDLARQKRHSAARQCAIDPLEDSFRLPGSELPEQILEQGEERAAKLRAVMLLPPETRRLLVLKYVLELSNRELADRMGTNEVNIRKMLSRSRRKLCLLLEEIQ